MSVIIQRPEKYVLEDLGLPYPITIENGVELEIDSETGDELSMTILNYDSFIRTLALVRCAIPRRFNGQEVRFLRTVRDLTARELAAELCIDHATLSRIENNKQAMGETLDRLLRISSCTDLEEEGLTPPIKYNTLREMALKAQFQDGEDPSITLCFRPQKTKSEDPEENGWDSELLAA